MTFPILPTSLSEISPSKTYEAGFDSDVYGIIAFAEQKLKVKRETRPRRPVLPNNPSAFAAVIFATEMKQYESDISGFELREREILNHNDKVVVLIKDYIKHEGGLYIIPRQYQSKVWSKAWQDGHSDGYCSVYNHLCELVELFD